MDASSTSSQWRTHPNAGGPAGMLLAIHDQFRAASRRIVELAQQGDHGLPMVARVFGSLAETLHHHHHAEEAMLFPLIHRRTGAAPEQLVTDHEELTAAIGALESALRARAEGATVKAAVAAFHAILIAHLDREEALVMPVLLTMTPHEGWSQIHG
jgi:iron-sulfur cluster repair protein YtfE (RIC family)